MTLEAKQSSAIIGEYSRCMHSETRLIQQRYKITEQGIVLMSVILATSFSQCGSLSSATEPPACGSYSMRCELKQTEKSTMLREVEPLPPIIERHGSPLTLDTMTTNRIKMRSLWVQIPAGGHLKFGNYFEANTLSDGDVADTHASWSNAARSLLGVDTFVHDRPSKLT